MECAFEQSLFKILPIMLLKNKKIAFRAVSRFGDEQKSHKIRVQTDNTRGQLCCPVVPSDCR